MPYEFCLKLFFYTEKTPGPIHREKEFSINFSQFKHILIAVDDFIVFTTPGQSKIGDTIIQMSAFEVENTRKSFAVKEEIPRRKITMQHLNIGLFFLDTSKYRLRLFEMPSHDMAFNRIYTLITPQACF